MKKYLLIILAAFSIEIAVSQQDNQSFLYTALGKLKSDSSLGLSPAQYRIWTKAERDIIGLLISKIEYPPIVLESIMEGRAILSFEFDSTGISDIHLLKKSASTAFDDSILEGFKKVNDKVLAKLRKAQTASNHPKSQTFGTYYITINFDLIDTEEYARRKGSIPIIRAKPWYVFSSIE